MLGAYFGGLAATSLVAGAATLLFSAYHFQQTSPLGVLGNLVSLPLVGFVMMPAAVLAVLAMPFGFEGPFLAALGWSIDRMLDLARLVAALERRDRREPAAVAVGAGDRPRRALLVRVLPRPLAAARPGAGDARRCSSSASTGRRTS